MTEIIVGRDLAQRYGRQYVFRALDVTVLPGVTGLIGPNGAGKTTLMSMIAGLRRPASGSLTVLGANIERAIDRRRLMSQLGFLPQTFGYYRSYSVREFVTYCAWLKCVPRGVIDERVRRALAATDLIGEASKKMRALSGGLLRRAGIAQAIVHEPRLLVLDEPFAGLDPQQRIQLRRLLRELGKEAHILLTTHLVDDVMIIADQVLVLGGGEIVFSGSPVDLEELADPRACGDSRLERGYATVLSSTRRSLMR